MGAAASLVPLRPATSPRDIDDIICLWTQKIINFIPITLVPRRPAKHT